MNTVIVKTIIYVVGALTMITLAVFAQPVLADKGTLRIASEPLKAKVFINGKRKGSTPNVRNEYLTLQLEEGEYNVRLIKNVEGGFEEWVGEEKALFVADDSIQVFKIDLRRQLSAKGKQFEQAIKTLVGHSDHVFSVAFSADGKILASGSADNTIKLWDARSGVLLKTLEHGSFVLSVAFSADGKTLASGYSTIKLWDVRSGALLETLVGHSSPVYSVAFSADGKALASGSWDKTVQLIDLSKLHLFE